MKYVMYLEAKNILTDYVKCSKLIELFSEQKTKIDVNKLSDLLRQKIVSIKRCHNKNLPFAKLEEPLQDNNILSSVEDIDENILLNNSSEILKNIHFHIRIHFEKEINIINLHYLVLLLQMHNYLIDEHRLSVFLVPRTASEYPFKNELEETDVEIYEKSSKYLRTIISKENQGIIYGVSREKKDLNDTIVKALNFKATGKEEDCFPIMLFNGTESGDQSTIDKYISFNKVSSEGRVNTFSASAINNFLLLFKDELAKEYFLIAQKLRANGRFGFADCENPHLALCDYIFEVSFYTLKSKFSNCNLNLSDFQDYIYDKLGHSTLFCFAIFSFLLDIEKSNSINFEVIRKNISNCINQSNEISDGLYQIIQNSLLHSQKKICLVSMSNCMITDKNGNTNKSLRIIVSDLSEDTILDTFQKNLSNEEKYLKSEDYMVFLSSADINKKYQELQNKMFKIRNDFFANDLGCFFNDFSNADDTVKKNWFAFRQVDTSAHIGLALFANSIKKSNGMFRVRSSKNYYDKDNMGQNYSFGELPNTVNHIGFPGTEFELYLPIHIEYELERHNITQLHSFNYNESYESYAKFLDFTYTPIASPVDKKQYNNIYKKAVESHKELSKFQLQMIWSNYWLSIFNNITFNIDKTIFCIDYSHISFNENFLKSNNAGEIIIKGLIDAIGIFSSIHSKKEIYLALINVDKKIMNIFQQVTSTLALKQFPENLQLFISDKDEKKQIHLLGKNYGMAIQNAYIIAIENGTKNYSGTIYFNIGKILIPFYDLIQNTTSGDSIKLIPFTSILDSKFNKHKMFFNKISNIAEGEMIEGNGYKFNNTHTKLGNKVHIDSFYEMSHLFYRTIMANNVAFEILRDLKKKVDLKNDNLIFYGYASYSQAILMSLTKILESYHLNCDEECHGEVSYAIYQYNPQRESNLSEIEIYQSKIDQQKKSFSKIIQIVPISSTLSTFSKMWAKFNRECNSEKSFCLTQNYTVFWVRDLNSKIEEKCAKDDDNNPLRLSEIESRYFNEPCNLYVDTKFPILNNIGVNYILQGFSNWQLPECCEQCFPVNNILNEIPLIETDQTSTVPSQQIYLKEINSEKIIAPLTTSEKKALCSLLGHIHYGHFVRGKNHYQFLVDTQAYFASVAEDVKEWLHELKRSDTFLQSSSPCLNIIFSPSHNTNVGFSQFVNAYYFNGTAEIISINEDKSFRSNFVCEHITIKRTIEKLFSDFMKSNIGYDFFVDAKQTNYKPIRFIFVDDNLITGETFRKASSFLQSLIPNELIEIYGTNVFDKCFVLLDRLSSSSQNSFILPHENYHAFCHLDISNIRRQGDSCIGCKLKKSANRLYKRSATQYSSNYWANKVKKYKENIFEKAIFDNKNSENNTSYLRAMLSHITKNFLDKAVDGDNCFELILALFNHLMGYSDFDDVFSPEQLNYLKSCRHIIYLESGDCTANLSPQKIKDYKNLSKKDIVIGLIKIISRPFFSYNQCIKRETLKFTIMLCESILSSEDGCCLHSKQGYLIANRITSLFATDEEKLDFLKNTILEALADMHSTYLLRKSTMIKILKFINNIKINSSCESKENQKSKCIIYNELDDKASCGFNKFECFFLFYSICVQRIIDESPDETRSLWLEHFLITGNDQYSNDYKTMSFDENCTSFYDTIIYGCSIDNLKTEVKKAFNLFCNEIFLSNGRIHFDGIEHAYTTKLEDDSYDSLDNYFLDYWKNVRNVDNYWLSNKQKNFKQYKSCAHIKQIDKNYDITKEISFYGLLFDEDNNCSKKGRALISDRYKLFLSRISDMLTSKYSLNPKSIRLALLTCSKEEGIPDIRDLEFVESSFSSEYEKMDEAIKRDSNSKYIIKKRVIKALSGKENSLLKKVGYIVEYSNGVKSNFEHFNLNDSFETIENTNHRKPYCILCFNNPYRQSDRVSGHETKKIVPVYLYISLDSSNDFQREKLPLLLLRDILSFRNGIVKYLECDFTSDVMKRYSYSIDTEAILKNEKVMSHTPMDQDKNEIDILISNDTISKISKAYNNIDSKIVNDIKDWTLARNYCNTMVARLYNRVFRNINLPIKEIILESLKSENREAYKLYIQENLNDGKSVPLININQILPSDSQEEEKDTIFNLFKKLIEFQIDSELRSCLALIYTDIDDMSSYAYNLDYIKSIIYRICFDALRFCFNSGTEYNNFVLRIANNYENKKRLEKNWTSDEKCLKYLSDSFSQSLCKIVFSFEECTESENFDWLVIKNVLFKTEIDNTGFLKKKLEDPLDFTDGHMSLITAKEYLSKLLTTKDSELLMNMYSYIKDDNYNYFVTKLPIIKKGL